MNDPAALIARRTGDWWQDDRRNWCAYCGIAIKPTKPSNLTPTSATRDHVIPRKHSGKHVTIPCCRGCNTAKGASGLPEFLLSEHLAAVRALERPARWPLRDLWLVMAMAAVEQARAHAQVWPVGVMPPAKKGAAGASPPKPGTPAGGKKSVPAAARTAGG